MQCLTYTDDQFQWIMMLAEVGQIREQSSNIEMLVDSGAACHALPCKVKPGSPREVRFLTVAGAPVESRGTMEVQFHLVDVHGEKIYVKAVFELLPVRRPILSVSCLVDKGFAVVMGSELGICVRRRRSCALWRTRIRGWCWTTQQELWVKLQHRGHDFHSNPGMKR